MGKYRVRMPLYIITRQHDQVVSIARIISPQFTPRFHSCINNHQSPTLTEDLLFDLASSTFIPSTNWKRICSIDIFLPFCKTNCKVHNCLSPVDTLSIALYHTSSYYWTVESFMESRNTDKLQTCLYIPPTTTDSLLVLHK